MTSLADRVARDEDEYLQLCRRFNVPAQFKAGRPDTYSVQAEQLRQKDWCERQRRECHAHQA